MVSGNQMQEIISYLTVFLWMDVVYPFAVQADREDRFMTRDRIRAHLGTSDSH